MAKLEDNTKRPNEVDEQSVTPRPPKKRFLSRASSPNEEDSDDNEDTSDTFKVCIYALITAINLVLNKYINKRSLWKHSKKMLSCVNGKITLWVFASRGPIFLTNYVIIAIDSKMEEICRTSWIKQVEEWRTSSLMGRCFQKGTSNDSIVEHTKLIHLKN